MPADNPITKAEERAAYMDGQLLAVSRPPLVPKPEHVVARAIIAGALAIAAAIRTLKTEA